MRYFFLIFIFLYFPLFSLEKENNFEEQVLRKLFAHILIEDYESAYLEAKEAIEKYNSSFSLKKAYIEILFAKEKELEAIGYLHKHFNDKQSELDRNFLENISWRIIQKNSHSSQYSVRLASLIGAYLTHDVKAIDFFLHAMRDSNAIIRCVGVQLASDYKDEILKKEIRTLLKEEKVWLVRLELIKAIGKLEMKEYSDYLQKIIASTTTSYEEKTLAIQALLHIYDKLSINDLINLSKNQKAGLRQLICEVASYQKEKDFLPIILQLVKDPDYEVKIAAYNAIGQYYRHLCSKEEIQEIVSKGMKDNHPHVAITAAWLGMLCRNEKANEYMHKWLHAERKDLRHFASSAVAAAGAYSTQFAKKEIHKSEDIFVKANLALGLIGQRESIATCCDILSEALDKKDCMWMWDNSKNQLFNALTNSHIRHVDQIPQYPEAIDMITQLHLLSVLIMMEDRNACDKVKTFLKNKRWGITGVAAATLVQEGDEESLEMIRCLLQDPDVKLRIQSALVLANFGKDEAVIPILQQAYDKADREMKIVILEALGHVGKTDSIDFFLQVMKEPFSLLRVVNASSLIQCLNN